MAFFFFLNLAEVFQMGIDTRSYKCNTQGITFRNEMQKRFLRKALLNV